MDDIRVKPLSRHGADLRRFLRLSHTLYRDDPRWVAPLLADRRRLFSDENPFFAHADLQLWLAERGGRDLGGIAGIVDRHYNNYQKDQAGFFGFFECVNDRAVSRALFTAVLDWAARQGLKRVVGPLNPTTNEECGLLIQGFDSPPMFMMTYNPPCYADLVAAAGFTKAKDILAYTFGLDGAPVERFERFARKFNHRAPDIAIVPLTRRNLNESLPRIQEVYNDAWRDNWGFVPMTDGEVKFMADRLKPLLTEGLAFVAHNAHESVGFLVALPDFNQALKPLKGRMLTPRLVGFLPYLFGWKVPDACRVVTLGVKTAYRGRGIETAMIAEGLRTGFKLGFRSVEASWILEDNAAVQRVIALFGGQPYKTYRIYERAL